MMIVGIAFVTMQYRFPIISRAIYTMHAIKNWFRSQYNASSRDHFVTGWYVLTGLALLAGAYVRLKGLGKSPFAVDEYFIATSVKNILDHGLPQFACGGYYVRGILLQYLVAPFFKYGSSDEFYFRLITVICNVLTVPGLYLLARRISGNTVACLVSILFCLSIWQIEFARFARMYSLFQMLFVWYFYFLYKALILDEKQAKKWLYLISLLSIFVYEGSVFLALLNFLSLIRGKAWTRFKEYIPAILIVSLSLVMNVIDFRRLGVEEILPRDVMDVPTGAEDGWHLPIKLPVLFVSTLFSNLPWMLAFLIPLTTSVFAIRHLFTRYRPGQGSRYELLQACVFGVFIVLSLFNLYGLLAAGLLFITITGFMIDGYDVRYTSLRNVALTSIVIGITFIFWLCYAISDDSWRDLLDTQRTSLIEHLLIVFFAYPQTYSKIVWPWFHTMPVLTGMVAFLGISGLLHSAMRMCKGREGYLFLILIILVLAIIMSVLKQPYYSIRYTYFLYPILLLVVCISLQWLAMSISRSINTYRMSLGVLFVTFMVAGEDFGIDHLWHIDEDRIIYRIGMDRSKKQQYYPRSDFRTAAGIVNNGLEAGDIVVSTAYGVPYYLRQLDYFFMSYDDPTFDGIIACKGKKDLWTNAKFIYESGDLVKLLQNSTSTVWLIGRPKYWEGGNAKSIFTERVLNHYRVSRNVEGVVNVYRIPSKKGR